MPRHEALPTFPPRPDPIAGFLMSFPQVAPWQGQTRGCSPRTDPWNEQPMFVRLERGADAERATRHAIENPRAQGGWGWHHQPEHAYGSVVAVSDVFLEFNKNSIHTQPTNDTVEYLSRLNSQQTPRAIVRLLVRPRKTTTATRPSASSHVS
jgi:hypothetical protein